MATRGIAFGVTPVYFPHVALHDPYATSYLQWRGIAVHKWRGTDIERCGFIAAQYPSPQGLRRYATYWDQLAYCPSPLDLDPMPDIAIDLFELESAGILRIYRDVMSHHEELDSALPAPAGTVFDSTGGLGPVARVNLGGVMPPYRFVQSQSDSVLDWTTGYEVQPGGHSDAHLYMPNPSSGQPSSSLEAILNNALPGPHPTVPIDVIIDFRQRRRPELLALRGAMHELSVAVEQASNTSAAIAAAREHIDRELTTLHRLFHESRIRRTVDTLRMFLAVDEPAMVKAALGALGGEALHVSPVLGALAGIGINAALTFVQRRATKYEKIPPPTRDFLYAYLAGSIGANKRRA